MSNSPFILELDAIYQKGFTSQNVANVYFPKYVKNRKKIINILMSGDVQDALYNILTCEGSEGKKLLKILGNMSPHQILDTQQVAGLLAKLGA